MRVGLVDIGTLLVMMFFSFTAVSGQLVLVESADEVNGVISNLDDNEMSVAWGIKNEGNQTVFALVTRQLDATVTPYNCPYDSEESGAFDRFCWGVICYPFCSGSSSDSPANLVAIAPGETNSSFVADYYHSGTAGTTSLTYCFHPLSGPNDGVCHSVDFVVIEDVEGCTYSTAVNYIEMATSDDGSCLFPGCMDLEALNYSVHFNVPSEDCIYALQTTECAADISGDGVVNVSDLLALLANFGVECN